MGLHEAIHALVYTHRLFPLLVPSASFVRDSGLLLLPDECSLHVNRFPGPPPLSCTSSSSWKAPSVFVPGLPLLPRTPSSQPRGVLAETRKRKQCLVASHCLRNSCPASVCVSYVSRQPQHCYLHPKGQSLHCIVSNFCS